MFISLLFSLSIGHVDVNECEDDPCEGKGRCVNSYGSYTCHCHAGYSQVITQNRKFCQGEAANPKETKKKNGATSAEHNDHFLPSGSPPNWQTSTSAAYLESARMAIVSTRRDRTPASATTATPSPGGATVKVTLTRHCLPVCYSAEVRARRIKSPNCV